MQSIVDGAILGTEQPSDGRVAVAMRGGDGRWRPVSSDSIRRSSIADGGGLATGVDPVAEPSQPRGGALANRIVSHPSTHRKSGVFTHDAAPAAA